MPQKPTCYISYARDAEILNFLVRLKSEIEKKSQNKVNVILDRKDFKVGEDFKRKEKQILESDLILIFFTPEYKKKVDTPIENSGCFREFNYIIEKGMRMNDIYILFYLKVILKVQSQEIYAMLHIILKPQL